MYKISGEVLKFIENPIEKKDSLTDSRRKGFSEGRNSVRDHPGKSLSTLLFLSEMKPVNHIYFGNALADTDFVNRKKNETPDVHGRHQICSHKCEKELETLKGA